jgi:hypothetical protein
LLQLVFDLYKITNRQKQDFKKLEKNRVGFRHVIILILNP